MRLWHRLVEPTAAITDTQHHREARVIAGLSLALIFVAIGGILVTVSRYTDTQKVAVLPACVGTALFVYPYHLSRRGKVQGAINALAVIASVLISSAIYAVGGSTGRDITYYYIMVTLFISAFSRRFYTFLWVAAVVVIIAVFQLFNPALEWSDTIRGPLAFNVFGAAIILTVTSFWNTREREKRTQLEISERKRTELLVQQEQQRVLSKFVAAVTHDFRNRLSTVEVNQHLLRRKLERGDRLDTVAEHIDKTHTAVQQMTYQMENMGLVIGLENTTQTKVDLQLTVDGIARRMQRVAQERHVTLTIVPQAERVYANCNHAHIEVALQQLIQNAVAYTPPGGGVTVTFAHTDETITVTVRDDGIGIAAEHLPHIFEPFYKIDDARTTSQAGLGLGLTLVKLIAEAYHGAITVESEPGVGSTFRFSLPTQPPLL